METSSPHQPQQQPKHNLIITSSIPTSLSTSYLQARSVPQTPSILSRSPSHTALRSNRRSFHQDYFSPSVHPHKSIAHPHNNHPQNGQHQTRPKRPTRSDSEWLHLTGLALSQGTAESKGQSWLATRSSSTSLVDDEIYETPFQTPRHNFHLPSNTSTATGHVADDELSPVTSFSMSRRSSFDRSRPHARASHSGRQSRRSSRTGLGLGMTYTYSNTGASFDGTRTPKVRSRRASMTGDMTTLSPDFVEPNELTESFAEVNGDDLSESSESEVDESDLRSSIFRSNSSYGLSSVIDSFFNFSLFKVDDDDPDNDENENEVASSSAPLPLDGARGETNEARKRRRRRENERRPDFTSTEGIVEVPRLEEGEEGSWRDVAWLLSVASKIIL
ncbi:MAG: hypothetical protein M1834_004558 [Cirrosporium novae-zelandiae]|nr:MAG: hypothetical protein M1834_004558 [Cirrosporium novae-zelandiae]